MSCWSMAADVAPQVVLSTSKAGPRQVESLTQRSILRDYRFAWVNLSQALESNSNGALNGLFDGTASAWFNDAVTAFKNNSSKNGAFFESSMEIS